jgi:hypothetical protein
MTAALLEKAQTFSVRGSGPQGLRRPRFSFFRFTFQTARSLAAPSSRHAPAEPENLPRPEPKNIKPVTSDAATNMATKSMAGCSVTV